MGDVSVIARRLENGNRVQYGWGGNGGYFMNVGASLLCWYTGPEKVEYLFGLGQMKWIGQPESEQGGASWLDTNMPANMPHWLGETERDIFSRIAFVDYGYFYDLDKTWYYILPGPFRIKVPLAYIWKHLDKKGYEFDECKLIERKTAEYILGSFYSSDPDLQSLVNERYPQGIEAIREDVLFSENSYYPCHQIWEKYKAIYDFLDDWVVVKTDMSMTEITGFLVHRDQTEEGTEREETIYWK